jgi:ABC-2 type transport system permease protein
MVAAGLNLVPPAVLILGVGTLAFGIRPRAASGACYAVLAWSFLVELIGGIVNASHWLLDTSVFHQMAAAPAVAPDWTTNAVLVALGVAAAAIGGIVFRFRDLAGA